MGGNLTTRQQPWNLGRIERMKQHAVSAVRTRAAGPCAAQWGGLVLTAALSSGCAIADVYRQCGFHGCPGDTAITLAVRARFGDHPSIDAPNLINIQTLGGVVYLYGLVDTEMERDLAGSVAGTAPGVHRVVNSIGIENVSR